MAERLTRKWLPSVAAVLLLACMTCLGGCNKSDPAPVRIQSPVSIPVMFFINPETGLSGNEELVERFNEAYEGQYQVQVEWVTGSAESYRSQVKLLNALDQLPAVITDVGFDQDFYELMKNNGRMVDLTPYMDEEWRGALDQNMLESCQEEDGSIYLLPSGSDLFSYAGFFYNKELLAAAGVNDFPESWDDFKSLLVKLSNEGITPLAMHGMGSYWAAFLTGTAYMAGTEAGMEFMRTPFPDSYQNEPMESMLSFIKVLYQYADTDALEIDHDESVKRFREGRNAIYPDGYWIHTDMSEEQKSRIGFAPFPGNVLMADPKMSAWSLTTGQDEEVLRGAVAFLKFRTLWEAGNAGDLAEGRRDSLMDREYLAAVQNVDNIMPNYQLMWKTGIHIDFLVENLPNYLGGSMDGKEFLKLMDQRVMDIMELE